MHHRTRQQMIQNYLKTLNWEVLLHPAYSLDLALSDLSPVFIDGPRAR